MPKRCPIHPIDVKDWERMPHGSFLQAGNDSFLSLYRADAGRRRKHEGLDLSRNEGFMRPALPLTFEVNQHDRSDSWKLMPLQAFGAMDVDLHPTV